ncbi:HNH endonuclease [Pseudonocardia sp. C8]|uniref:HNH endonuclease n=1 Tax=Saccharopolyspora cebuensis TaxID=418759 RepID=A0ABV4CN86_9PSEU|nr:HNH endonuclease signature motif containing protein [Pseudonocardia sp. C8]MBC3194055.1 HNH endonuclease [Pseudonocardia sp. C8]
MTISDKDRKVLWARSGNRCALCRQPLVAERTATDPEAVVGDEAHIAARSPGGPRYGESPANLVDSYDNLILLCRVDHKKVDDQSASYTSAVLRQMKSDHELWVDRSLQGLDDPKLSKTDREQWYPLEVGRFPCVGDGEAARVSVVARLRDSLIESFGDRSARFALVLAAEGHNANDAVLPVYVVWSHQREFVARAAHEHEACLRRIIDIRRGSSDVEAARHQFLREITEAERSTADWRMEGNALFDKHPTAHLVNYDPSLRRIQIHADRALDIDPEEYDEKVATTSEALMFSCALARQVVAADIGSLTRYSENSSLAKLTAYMLERRELEFGRFRILQNDPEIWDFRFPETEARGC